MRDKRIVFIFDECHRSQFGETHNRIKTFFNNHQLFGFTGTPIFADNAIKNELGKRTTKELFGDCLHKYVITDAINDQNVLKFAVEYVGRYKRRESSTEIDMMLKTLIARVMESPQRLEDCRDYIIAHHDRKTHSRDFTAILRWKHRYAGTILRYIKQKRRLASTTCALPLYLAMWLMRTMPMPMDLSPKRCRWWKIRLPFMA